MTWERREGTVLAPEGRELRGLCLPYGVETTVHGVRERFESQAATSTGEAILNAYHRDDRPLAREPGTLFFESRADGFYLRADLPATAEADDALALVRADILNGFSVEFRADEEKLVGGVRVIERATVAGVALLTRPAYKTTYVEARGAAIALALVEASTGPEIEAAATSAGISAEQLRRALAAFGSEPDPTTRPNPSVPWWVA